MLNAQREELDRIVDTVKDMDEQCGSKHQLTRVGGKTSQKLGLELDQGPRASGAAPQITLAWMHGRRVLDPLPLLGVDVWLGTSMTFAWELH